MQRKIWIVWLSIAAVLFATAMAAQTGTAKRSGAAQEKPGLPSQATLNGFLKHMFGYDSTITWRVLAVEPTAVAGVSDVTVLLQNSQGQQTVRLYVLPGEKYAIAGEMMPFGADPFAPARKELAEHANGVAHGPENAPVTVVEFSDLECPSCKMAQPTMERLIKDEPDMKFIFQTYPLEQMHPWSLLGAKYAECVAQQSKDAFWKYISSVYADQEQITALLPQNVANPMSQAEPQIAKKLQDLAGAAGVDAQQVAACTKGAAVVAQIDKSIALGNTLGITGTPTLFVNGRKISNVNGMPYELLKSMVDAAKQGK
jgi:protein-disulfide isomerase